MNLQAGTKVLVEAVVTSCGNTICGIALHGYENKKRLVEVIKEHVHPFTGVQEWRPIESAPKDGTNIWVAFRDKDDHYYQTEAWWSDSGETGTWRAASFKICPLRKVTHWLPLPPPPSSAEQGEG